jgi:hypothetical protein
MMARESFIGGDRLSDSIVELTIPSNWRTLGSSEKVDLPICTLGDRSNILMAQSIRANS